MSYRTLAACTTDLERTGQLRRIHFPVDARLEVAAIQRRVQARGGPALLFTNVAGCAFPMLGNLFGTMNRTRFIFRSALRQVEQILKAKACPLDVLRHPMEYARVIPALWHALPKTVATGPATSCRTTLSALPQLVSWPMDGGGFVTLPQVYSESIERPGYCKSNLGMYRVQLTGKNYVPDKEAGLHYQIHRGIGSHHAEALAAGKELPVVVSVGGPPALTLASVFPLPPELPELCFAGLLAGHRIPMIHRRGQLPIPAEADFTIVGRVQPGRTALEGPFGDHLGYYSLEHEFPVLTVDTVYHRPGAIWPFTSVGRPPQEDTIFGAFIHDLTRDLVPTVFSGIREVHAVDAAGVHPLLLAIGHERYVPYEHERKPQEIITSGLNLLGTTQTSLSKYLFIAAHEDAPELSAQTIPEFFSHMLRRTDFFRDLHFITRTTTDTLDYTGIALNEGSKLLWTVAGPERRELATHLPSNLRLPNGFHNPVLFAPGIMVCEGPKHTHSRGNSSPEGEQLADALHTLTNTGIALVVLVDDASFSAKNWNNFLWVTFTRSDPATDSYGPNATTHSKHWGCDAPLVIDARLKHFQAPPLEADPAVERKVDAWGAHGGPLYGLV